MKTENISRAAIMLLMMLLTTVTAWADSAFSGGDGSQGNPYKIANTADLDQLATDVNGGKSYEGSYFVLTKDITYSTTGLGETASNYTPIGGYHDSDYKNFKGHFDGQNHTVSGIRIYKGGYDEADYCQALFGCIKGATVKNVIIADARITGHYECGGIVGYVVESGRIENCHALSNVTIHAVQYDAYCHGGIVGSLTNIKDVTVVKGCTSAASITTAANIYCESFGGIVGYVGSNCTVSDCIYLGSTVEGNAKVGAIAGSNYTNSTVRNCYYTNSSIASAVGDNNGGTVTDVRLATSDDFAVSGDTYTIGSTAGWSIFCGALYHNNTYNRFSGKTVKLDKNITVSRMAGSSDHDFTGTFDGGGNTLTFNHGTSDSYASDEYAAPFCYVSTVTPSGGSEVTAAISNLHVAGDIYTSAKYAAGLVARLWGTVTIGNCRVSTVIHSSTSGDGTHGGVVAINSSSKLTIEGCVFDGKLLTVGTTDTGNCAGFIGWGGNGCTITNCLYAPTALDTGENEVVDGSGSNPSRTFARDAVSANFTNNYYTRTLGTAQGKQARSITAGQSITVALSGTATEYNVSGITAYKDGETQKLGLKYGDAIYAANEEVLSLTLPNITTVPTGYTFGYTVSSGTLDGNGTDGYTLTMPDADVTVSSVLRSTGQAVPVAYVDENGKLHNDLDGNLTPDDNTDNAIFAIALDGTEEVGYGYGWISLSDDAYYVGTDITYNNRTIEFSDNNGATLILGDGATMTVTSETVDDHAKYTIGGDKLTICGQALGTGKLNVSNTANGGNGIYAYNNITINGGMVTATDGNGIYSVHHAGPSERNGK